MPEQRCKKSFKDAHCHGEVTFSLTEGWREKKGESFKLFDSCIAVSSSSAMEIESMFAQIGCLIKQAHRYVGK